MYYALAFGQWHLAAACNIVESASRAVNVSNPKPGHTTGGSGRTARRSGRAGSGKIGCQQNHSLRKQKSTVLSKASNKYRFNVTPEARTSEILCKPTEDRNPRLTRGLSEGREALFVPGCRPVVQRLFVFVHSFYARYVREMLFFFLAADQRTNACFRFKPFSLTYLRVNHGFCLPIGLHKIPRHIGVVTLESKREQRNP